jgi:hypothetical protein
MLFGKPWSLISIVLSQSQWTDQSAISIISIKWYQMHQLANCDMRVMHLSSTKFPHISASFGASVEFTASAVSAVAADGAVWRRRSNAQTLPRRDMRNGEAVELWRWCTAAERDEAQRLFPQVVQHAKWTSGWKVNHSNWNWNFLLTPLAFTYNPATDNKQSWP